MQLGRGAFGRVFLAELKDTGEKFAIKSIRKDKVLMNQMLEKIRLEKDMLFELDHPFLCGMKYFFQTDLRLYFVMPFIQGGEMYRILCTVKKFEERMAKFYAAQLVIAVGHLHERGYMHRDLKLENIMMDESGYLKIIDFGLAKIIVSNEISFTQCGTPEYFAPEII